ncbi:MAG: hypothetical protein JOY64_03645 [Alphaproteobacteria bacterium]|nr:hypothetical protein [Alphaproteobacteria bacterium]MBV8406699.1 hypothetical protein [Alphaproteobacteria bacterium]
MRTLKLSDLAAVIERRKALLGLSGNDYVLPNTGEFRSPEKRDLLRAIAEESAEQGKPPAFRSEFSRKP